MKIIQFALALSISAAPVLAHAAKADSPFTPARRQLGQATQLIVQGKYAQAEPFVRQALALDPSHAEAHYNLGVVLRSTGRQSQAIDAYRSALELFGPDLSNHAKCLYGIALAAEDVGDPELSARAWRDYLTFTRENRPNDPTIAIAQTHLGVAERVVADLHRRKIPGTQKATR